MGVLQTGCSSHVAAETLSWWLRLCCLRECHPWWHQMFRTSLCMCVSLCMWLRMLNESLCFYSCPHNIIKSYFFYSHIVFCVYVWVCLQQKDVFKFNEVLPFLLFKHPPCVIHTPTDICFMVRVYSSLCVCACNVQPWSIFLNVLKASLGGMNIWYIKNDLVQQRFITDDWLYGRCQGVKIFKILWCTEQAFYLPWDN